MVTLVSVSGSNVHHRLTNDLCEKIDVESLLCSSNKETSSLETSMSPSREFLYQLKQHHARYFRRYSLKWVLYISTSV